MSAGSRSTRAIAARAASTEIVITSSSGPGTLFALMFKPRPIASPSPPPTPPRSSDPRGRPRARPREQDILEIGELHGELVDVLRLHVHDHRGLQGVRLDRDHRGPPVLHAREEERALARRAVDP